MIALGVAAFPQQKPVEPNPLTAPAATPEALTLKANAGDANAAFALGAMHERGNGVRQNAAEAVKWYRKAAEQGHAAAQFNLALILAKGRGVAANPVEAAKWYERAAAQGDVQAATNLGILYAQGKGVKQDMAQAARWFKQAAEAGNPMAEYNLGLLYSDQMFSEGKTEAEDDKQAALWLSRAADHGVVAAQNNLGVLYADGRGVEKDIVQAYKWFLLASQGGDADSAQSVKTLEGELRPEEIAQAKKLASDWIAAHTREIKIK